MFKILTITLCSCTPRCMPFAPDLPLCNERYMNSPQVDHGPRCLSRIFVHVGVICQNSTTPFSTIVGVYSWLSSCRLEVVCECACADGSVNTVQVVCAVDLQELEHTWAKRHVMTNDGGCVGRDRCGNRIEHEYPVCASDQPCGREGLQQG